jgi:hypothetical protein
MIYLEYLINQKIKKFNQIISKIILSMMIEILIENKYILIQGE